MSRIHSFPPIEDVSARILVLGSMPGKESLRAYQYYAHPRNAFWRIMNDLLIAPSTLPYEARIQLLKQSRIAVWDVLASCVRTGSLDADIDIKSLSPNNFEAFFQVHPHITHVFFNGALAEKCFQIHVLPGLTSWQLQYHRLPSTSPAYAAMLYENKLNAWKIILAACRGAACRLAACREV